MIVVDVVYFIFVFLLKFILYNSNPQNQMCDWNQKCFCFVTKILNQAFYMPQTFASKVSLQYWLLWLTVRRLQKIPNMFFTILVLIHTLKSILYETIGSFHYLSTCRDVLENDFQYLTLMQNSLDKGWHQGKPRIEWQPVIEGICSVKI